MSWSLILSENRTRDEIAKKLKEVENDRENRQNRCNKRTPKND